MVGGHNHGFNRRHFRDYRSRYDYDDRRLGRHDVNIVSDTSKDNDSYSWYQDVTHPGDLHRNEDRRLDSAYRNNK